MSKSISISEYYRITDIRQQWEYLDSMSENELNRGG